MLHVEKNKPKHSRSQQEARLKGYNLLAHEFNDKEHIDDVNMRLQSIYPAARDTYSFLVKQYALYGKCFPSVDTIARRGRGNDYVVSPRTVHRHLRLLVKVGLLHMQYRHFKTSLYTIDAWFMKNRDFFRKYLPSVAFLSLSLLLSSVDAFEGRVIQNKYKLNTNTSSSLIFSKNNLPLNKFRVSDMYVTKKGLLMNSIPPYILDITELNLEPAGAIELSAFSEADILYGRKALQKQTVKLLNPFAWLVSVCKVSATNAGRQPNWVLVNQMKLIAGVTDKCLRYTEVEGRSELSPYGSSFMNNNYKKSSHKGKVKDVAYEPYKPVERVAEEDPLVAAFKVAKAVCTVNYYFGNPWYDKLTHDQKVSLHQEYPTYARLAHVNSPSVESLSKNNSTNLDLEDESIWVEIDEIVSGMSNFKREPLDEASLPLYTVEKDEFDEMVERYVSRPSEGGRNLSRSHFQPIGNILESVLGTQP